MDYLLLYLIGMNYVLSYLGIALSLGLLDYLWLWIIMKDRIQFWMGWLIKDTIDRAPALGFYLLYSLSILLLVVIPQSKHGTLQTTVLYGALVWFTAYMTYDLTNRATLKNRPIAMVVPDILWGTVVTAVVSMVGYVVFMKFMA